MGTIYSYVTGQGQYFFERFKQMIIQRQGSSSTTGKCLTTSQNQAEPSEYPNKPDVTVKQAPCKCVPTVFPEGSSPPQLTANSHSDAPQTPPQYTLSSPLHDETAKVDKINLIVKCAGKLITVDMFPLESISVLLKEACEVAEKKPEKMSLVFEGDHLDVNKTVSQYPNLRGGTIVHLIHAC